MNAKQIKEKIGIPEYLQSLGIEASRRTQRGIMYCCPWRDDRHPSLSVTPDGRQWYDHSTGESGSVLDLAMKILKTDSLAAVCEMFSSSSFPQSMQYDQRKEKEDFEAFKSFDVVPLKSGGLFSYLDERGIPSRVAKMYCQEARYSFNGKDKELYAISFKNDKGGYELRSQYFKGSKSPKGITTYLDIKNAPIIVFEGFFDFLSFVVMEGERRNNYCILNSVTNIGDAIERLSELSEKVYLCLDNDEAGRKATAQIAAALGSRVLDISNRYRPKKDLNEFLMKHYRLQVK